MANFKIAYEITMGHEGSYSNDPVDVGGETFKGVSRVYHPSWEGWVLIDEYKNKPNFPRNLKGNQELEKFVEVFYKRMFWDIMRLDNVNSQMIANEMFDTGVNMNHTRAVSFLQEGLNLLNRNEQNYPDLVVDGFIGPVTLRTLDTLLKMGDEYILLKIMNVLQGMHYINFMRKSPTQERFARGWFGRVAL